MMANDSGMSASGVRKEIGSVLQKVPSITRSQPICQGRHAIAAAADSIRTTTANMNSSSCADRSTAIAGQNPKCPSWDSSEGHAASATNSDGIRSTGPVPQWPGKEIGDAMRRVFREFQNAALRCLATTTLALLVGVGGAIAQSGDLRAQDQNAKPPANANQQTQPPADALKESQKKADEFAEAAQAINGPAGNPECVWLGRRVVVLMWRDDLDTAFRHLDLYDRFGCPTGHIQASFRCLVRSGPIDPKLPDSLSGRVHACWINPNPQQQPAAAAAQPAKPAASAQPEQTPAPAPAKAGPAK
jgi:hypothetical protein